MLIELDEFEDFEFAVDAQKSQLEIYLDEPRSKRTSSINVLEFWRSQQFRYPELAKLARDVLVVPISTVASKSAFSLGGRILDQYRSSMSPQVVKALICSRDWPFGENDISPVKLEDVTQDIMALDLNKGEPRYYCRTCKRHWTRGGTLRNVPEGGGSSKKSHRKNRNLSPSSSSVAADAMKLPAQPPMPHAAPAVAAAAGIGASLPPLPSYFYGGGGGNEFPAFQIPRGGVAPPGLNPLDGISMQRLVQQPRLSLALRHQNLLVLQQLQQQSNAAEQNQIRHQSNASMAELVFNRLVLDLNWAATVVYLLSAMKNWASPKAEETKLHAAHNNWERSK
ncbi:hypothetical protein ZIOFF_067088 [Zingiber officinale]|uniref:Uncharacterized protein n=1 Tax=Zingiber officinale TaxID=94328 RepID=A0A8J5EVD7_ZINOF|nr:hypothetical protein ZIOFF_067088 [Zingiber officinale]